MRTLILILCAALPVAGQALAGYVVKVDGERVILDLGRSSGISESEGFEIFESGEDLKHPITGESLGPEIKKIAKGTIIEVQEKYSVGRLDAPSPAARAGMRVKRLRPVSSQPAAPAPRPAPNAAQDLSAPVPGATPKRAPNARSPLIPIRAIDITSGDIDGDGNPEAIIAGKRKILAFPLTSWQTAQDKMPSVCSFEDPSTGSRYLSLEAADIDQDGRAEVFATFHNRYFKTVETRVLDCEGGKFTARKTLPWMIRSYQPNEGPRRLAMQQVSIGRHFSQSGIYDLAYKDGKYQRTGKSLRFKRIDWVYGFGVSQRDGKPVEIMYNNADRIRLKFRKRSWTTPDKYGQTSERILWKDRTLRFSPRLLVDQNGAGLSSVYTVKNIPSFFGLSHAFGHYDRAELYQLRWNGLSLEPAWKADLGGYAAGLAEVSAKDGSSDKLLVAVVGANEDTSIWSFAK